MSNTILCGFQYAGKTTLGKYLAEKLNKPFIDTDDLVANVVFKEHSANNARNLYHAMGEANFRELERDVIGGLKQVKNSIIAIGGGSLLRPENRKVLRRMGTLIYLNWPIEVLKARTLDKGAGAFLDKNNLDESFQDVYTKRHDIFLQVAHVQIEMINETIEEASHKILNFIQGRKYGE